MNRALVVAIAALMATLPFSHTAALVRLLLAIALVATIVIAYRIGPRWKDLAPPFATCWLGWFGWSVLSMGWSVDPDYTASELRSEFFYGAIMIVVAQYALMREGAERIMMPVLATVSVALGLLAGGYFLAFGSVEVPDIPFGGPGNLSSVVLTLFPVACAAALVPGAGVAARRLGFTMALALLVAALATLNRTVWPALAAEIILVALLVRPIKADARRLAALGVIALVFAIAQVTIAHSVRFSEGSPAAKALAQRGDPRPAIWADAIERIESRPILGHGYGRGILRNEFQKKFDNNLIWHAHNIFLDAGLQLGIPGMFLLAALFAAIGLAGMTLARSSDVVARLSGAALVAVVAGTLVRNFTDDLWARQNALLFWAIVGGLVGLGMRRMRAAAAARAATS
jgi:O-antigen ligase